MIEVIIVFFLMFSIDSFYVRFKKTEFFNDLKKLFSDSDNECSSSKSNYATKDYLNDNLYKIEYKRDSFYDNDYNSTKNSNRRKTYLDNRYRIEYKDNSFYDNYCPVCGGILVRRVAKRGYYKGEAFWGCENFPSCRYIRHIG